MGPARQLLGIVGSYRKEGTIDTLVSEVLAAAAAAGARTDKIYLCDCHIEFCTNCRGCTQDPGEARVPCVVHSDDMEGVLDRVEQADAIVIGAPVNVGSANALTQRFVERCVGYYYWPWGTRGGPRLRNKAKPRKAVLVSSSAAPSLMNSALFGMGAVRTLEAFAEIVGAEVVDVIKVGLVTDREIAVSQRALRKARTTGRRLTA